MNNQESSEECLKEQKELPEKEMKKSLEQAEVLTNSSIEMSFKTDSDLLIISVTPKLINLMPQLNEIFPLEPDGSGPTFLRLLEKSLREKRVKEFAEEIAMTANAIVE
ncbi:MAG: hypothetical protein GY861_06535 [bacterium]|nr:hypothetical protein [bacterium]